MDESLSAVCTVGEKTIQKFKDKIKKLKTTKNEGDHESPDFDTFDGVSGIIDVMTMPFVKEVNVKKQLLTLQVNN